MKIDLLTKADVKRIAPRARPKVIDALLRQLLLEGDEWGLNTPKRVCHFLAQICHESGGLYYVREIASGADYEDRKDLGNVRPGDGKRYRGRGLIQITGRANYRAASEALGVDFEANPRLLSQPEHAVRSAMWYWFSRKLYRYADRDNIKKITKLINGGYNGLADRKRWFRRWWAQLGEGTRMSQSSTVKAGLVAGGTAAGVGGNTVMSLLDTGSDVADRVGTIQYALNLPWIVTGFLLAAGVVGFCIWWIIRERFIKSDLYGV